MLGDDDDLLEQVQRQVEDAIGLPADQFVRAGRTAVAEVMLATFPDGSWPDAALIREAVSMALVVVDAEGIRTMDTDGEDLRWLDACRAIDHSVELLDDMLDDLRSTIRPPGPSVNNAG